MDRSSSNITMNFNPIYIHQEEEPVVAELNENSLNIIKDIEQIDNSLFWS